MTMGLATLMLCASLCTATPKLHGVSGRSPLQLNSTAANAIDTPAANGSHLKYMSFCDFNPPAMDGWVNMGLALNPGWPAPGDAGLAGQLAAWNKYKIWSLFYMELVGDWPKMWATSSGLLPGWEAVVEEIVQQFKPVFGPGKAIRGVMIGDELCCRNVTCWKQYVPLTEKLRSELGPEAILYTNECWLGAKPAGNMGQVTIAPEFDLFSVDTYQWDYTNTAAGAGEVEAVQNAWGTLKPLLGPKTKAMLVPGVFGCSNLSAIGVSNPIKPDGSDQQTQNVLVKINGMFEYAKSETWIAGINPWHFHNRGGNQAPGCPCDMRSGGESMPIVVDRLREIGGYILGSKTGAAPATVQAAAPVLVAETQSEILWYPLNSHTLYDSDVAAIFVRAQTSPDVDLVTTDAGFVSYDNGTTWAALGEQGLQERICYNYPLGNDASILCLQSADQSQYGNQTPGVATFFGSVWELKNGNLIRRSDEASIPVTFDYTAASAASLAMPNNTFMTMFTDGVSVQDTSGGTGVFVPILAAAQANPPGDLTQACRALVKQTCPGTQGHGDDCSSSLAAAAAAFAALHCPDPKVKSNYDWYCAAGVPLAVDGALQCKGTGLPNMIFVSDDGLKFHYRSQVVDATSPINGAINSSDENALVRLGDGRMMMVMRYDYADFIPSRSPMPSKGGAPPIAVGGLIQIMSYDDGHTWHDAAVMNGTMLPDQLGPDSPSQPNHPHNVEPKLVRLPALDLLVLSSGRCGQFVWWANESDVLAGMQGPVWHSVDLRLHHNNAVGTKHPAWKFAGNCAESTAYTNLNVLGDPEQATEVVVVYDQTQIEVPKTKPKNDEVNYLFSVRLSFGRASLGL